jgi:hypothetical protein
MRLPGFVDSSPGPSFSLYEKLEKIRDPEKISAGASKIPGG